MKNLIKKQIRNILMKLPPKVTHSIVYAIKHKAVLHWNEPKLYDEKIHWHTVNTYNGSYGKYADKYEVRNYVRECGLEHILIPLLAGPYDNFNQVDFDILPDEFVMKTTHASGTKHICIVEDKNKLDVRLMTEQFARALDEKFNRLFFEYHYGAIKPRIICEKLLHDTTSRMNDYKVVCTYGKPIAILVCYDRNNGRDYYSIDWEYLNYVKEEFRSGVVLDRPKCLDEMLVAASILSKPFPLCRIDFYIVDNRIYFGEVTLTPSAGNHENLTNYGQMELGKMIED